MSVRVLGLLKMVGCAVVGALLSGSARGCWCRERRAAGILGEIIKWALALPLVGFGIGLVELATGLPIQQADTAWQKAPGLREVPGGPGRRRSLPVGFPVGGLQGAGRLKP